MYPPPHSLAGQQRHSSAPPGQQPPQQQPPPPQLSGGHVANVIAMGGGGVGAPMPPSSSASSVHHNNTNNHHNNNVAYGGVTSSSSYGRPTAGAPAQQERWGVPNPLASSSSSSSSSSGAVAAAQHARAAPMGATMSSSSFAPSYPRQQQQHPPPAPSQQQRHGHHHHPPSQHHAAAQQQQHPHPQQQQHAAHHRAPATTTTTTDWRSTTGSPYLSSSPSTGPPSGFGTAAMRMSPQPHAATTNAATAMRAHAHAQQQQQHHSMRQTPQQQQQQAQQQQQQAQQHQHHHHQQQLFHHHQQATQLRQQQQQQQMQQQPHRTASHPHVHPQQPQQQSSMHSQQQQQQATSQAQQRYPNVLPPQHQPMQRSVLPPTPSTATATAAASGVADLSLPPQSQPHSRSSAAGGAGSSPSPGLDASQPAQQQTSSSSRRMLSAEAKEALTFAVVSALRSPTGTIEPKAMEHAMRLSGLSETSILQAAKMTRDREMAKRQRSQQTQSGDVTRKNPQQPQETIRRADAGAPSSDFSHGAATTHNTTPTTTTSTAPSLPRMTTTTISVKGATGTARVMPTSAVPYKKPFPQQPQPSVYQVAHKPSSHARTTTTAAATTTETTAAAAAAAANAKLVALQQQQLRSARQPTPTTSANTTAAALAHKKGQPPATDARTSTSATALEHSKWRRLQHGLFVSAATTGVAPPTATLLLGPICRSLDSRPVLSLSSLQKDAYKGWQALFGEASVLQSALQGGPDSNVVMENDKEADEDEDDQGEGVLMLLDAEKLKRFKVQPKREHNALEKAMRKKRQATADSLVRKNKEINKLIVARHADFLKFHRQRRSELSRLARAVRDHLDKAQKRQERDAEMAERERIAALKANDMAAYTALLEETRNERLKFLLDKTGDYMNEISGLLERGRDSDNDADAGAAAASSSATADESKPLAMVGSEREAEEDDDAKKQGGVSSYYASAHVKREEVRQPSILVGGTLKEYQIGGLQWLVSLYNNRLNGILADEMGLGKTVQAIALIAYLMEFKDNRGPYLVIVPLSTLSNWVNEFRRWCPAARVVSYKGNPTQRKYLYRQEVRDGRFNVLLTTYEYIIKDKASLRKLTWQYAIVDEGHRMKNAQSKFAVVLATQYTTRFRVLLTGTPLQNNLPELWALLNFLLPTIFNSVETFDQWFNRPFSQFRGGSSSSNADEGVAEGEQISTEERMLIIHRLHELLRPFMLRRVKSEVLGQLPEKLEKVVRCELSSWQKALYKQISASVLDSNDQGNEGGAATTMRGLNNVVMQLRKVCNHPYLFLPDTYYINDDLIRTSGKVQLLDRMLPKLQAAGHRVLMFTQMTAVMTILEEYFEYRGYKSLRLDGSTPSDDRAKRMELFNAPDSPFFIFLLSTRAGGLGLNLATADTVIIVDSDWNPMMDLQAMDRAHRIGQKRTVSVFRLVTNSPVEEKILSRATEKLNMSELVVEAGKFDKSSVEQDNSQERMKMMEVLLTDFDSTTASSAMTASTDALEEEGDGGGSGDVGDGGVVDAEGEDNEIDDLNEILSCNEADYQLYCEMDRKARKEGKAVVPLSTDSEDIPDWIRQPPSSSSKGSLNSSEWTDSNKRLASTKSVQYDDGLTEKQFLRLMEKQAQDEEDAAKARREAGRSRKLETPTATAPAMAPLSNSARKRKRVNSSDEALQEQPPAANQGLERKETLVKICKGLLGLREPGTRRLISEIFVDKPSAELYPDYYEIIQRPIAINDILGKARSSTAPYRTVEEFVADWELMFANAREYNADGSWVVLDAASLEKELHRLLSLHLRWRGASNGEATAAADGGKTNRAKRRRGGAGGGSESTGRTTQENRSNRRGGGGASRRKSNRRG